MIQYCTFKEVVTTCTVCSTTLLAFTCASRSKLSGHPAATQCPMSVSGGICTPFCFVRFRRGKQRGLSAECFYEEAASMKSPSLTSALFMQWLEVGVWVLEVRFTVASRERGWIHLFAGYSLQKSDFGNFVIIENLLRSWCPICMLNQLNSISSWEYNSRFESSPGWAPMSWADWEPQIEKTEVQN